MSITPYLPISANYGYTYSQQIYTQAQVNTAGEISKIRFYYVSGTTTPSLDWVIYMGHTNKTTFSSTTDWVLQASMTQVFSGQVTYPAVGNWMEITLATPFVYNNTDNLVIAIDENTSGFSSITWRSFTSGSNTGIYYRSDSSNPDPASLPTASGRTGTLAQAQLYFTEACPSPSAFSASNATQTSVDLAWTNGGSETQWKVKYGAPGFNPQTEGTLVDVTSKPFTLPSLTVSTAYQAYVKADCGGDQSGWVGPVSFTTLCNAFSAPIFESFESTTAPPTCWSVVYENSSPVIGNILTHSETVASEGIRSMRFSSYSFGSPYFQWLVSPELNYSTDMMVRFKYRKSSDSYAEVIAFGYSSTGSNVQTDFTWLPNITTMSITEWTEFETIVPLGTKYVAIKNAAAGSYGYVYIDEFKVINPPTCFKPTNFTVEPSSITADFSWINALPADDAWVLEYKLASEVDWTVVNIDESPYTLSGLTANSQYQARMKTDCGSGDESEYTSIIHFRTLQVPANLPFTEDFETNLNSWTVLNGNTSVNLVTIH